MAAESFDAVLAEVRKSFQTFAGTPLQHARIDSDAIDRLQSAHEAEVAELRKGIERRGDDWIVPAALWQEMDSGSLANKARADRAVGLLRECSPYLPAKGLPATVTARVHAFLSEQAGERENGDG